MQSAITTAVDGDQQREICLLKLQCYVICTDRWKMTALRPSKATVGSGSRLNESRTKCNENGKTEQRTTQV
jgi:hypothetical protein